MPGPHHALFDEMFRDLNELDLMTVSQISKRYGTTEKTVRSYMSQMNIFDLIKIKQDVVHVDIEAWREIIRFEGNSFRVPREIKSEVNRRQQQQGRDPDFLENGGLTTKLNLSSVSAQFFLLRVYQQSLRRTAFDELQAERAIQEGRTLKGEKL